MIADNFLLKDYKHCPVCKSAEREKAPNGIPSQGGETYLIHVSSRLGYSVTELIDQLEVFQCTQCKSFYLDPWLSDLHASNLFVTDSPVHRSGWANFQQWVDQLDNADLNRELPSSVLEFINSRYGEVSTYAEVGCPFQGYFFRLANKSSPTSNDIFFSSIKAPKLDNKFSTFPRIYRNLERLLSNLFILMFKMRNLRHKSTRLSPFRIEVPAMEKTLLTEDSLFRWGANCNAYGQSCKYFAQKCLEVQVLPIEYSFEHKRTFDLIGVHNSLDHSTDPIGLLTKCIKMSSMVLVTGHRNKTSAKQHLFAFSDQSIEKVVALIGDVSVIDVGLHLNLPQNSDSFFYLIRRP